jgi:hypothetical protein
MIVAQVCYQHALGGWIVVPNTKDESHLPYEQQSLVFRLRKRAEIRRQISTRKSVQEGKPDRMADLLEEAAQEIDLLRTQLISISQTKGEVNGS